MKPENDKTEGTYREYYQQGKMKVEWGYKNGVLDGITKKYDEKGDLINIF
jgi:antitoxin component YwqK of YwqJK toxin-antitoxin module